MHASPGAQTLLVAGLILSGVILCAEDTPSRQNLVVDQPTTLRFTSGVNNEKGRQQVQVKVRPGRYQLLLSNAGPRYSDQWIIWDYLALKTKDKTVWHIGKDHTGTGSGDYSERAFSEFAKKGAAGETAKFVVGKTLARNFCRELNDNDRTKASIEFTVSEEDAAKELTLLLSTLYSTHDGAGDFQMRLHLQRVK